MKRIVLLILCLPVVFILAGCNQGTVSAPTQTNANAAPAGQPSSANAQPEQAASPSTQNSNAGGAPALPTTAPAGPGVVPQALLRGTYAISEVQHDGLVEMVSPENTTEITFHPPASFTRLSKRGGKVDHTDSGEYDVFGNRELILKIMMSKQKIQLKPVVKRHPFSLSADGSEFRLTSEKGGVAVFRRTKLLPESQ